VLRHALAAVEVTKLLQVGNAVEMHDRSYNHQDVEDLVALKLQETQNEKIDLILMCLLLDQH